MRTGYNLVPLQRVINTCVCCFLVGVMGAVVGCQTSNVEETADDRPGPGIRVIPASIEKAVGSKTDPWATMSEESFGDEKAPFKAVEVDRGSPYSALVTIPKDRVFPIHGTGGSVAFYQQVSIPQLDVERIEEGRIRIWVRVKNLEEHDIFVNVKCAPDGDTMRDETYYFEEVIFQQDGFRDFSFILDGPLERKFTILVKPAYGGRVENSRLLGQTS